MNYQVHNRTSQCVALSSLPLSLDLALSAPHPGPGDWKEVVKGQ